MKLITIVDENWGVGFQGKQPFVIPNDRKRFRLYTMGNKLICGRRTYDVMGPLGGRELYVLTSGEIEPAEGVHAVHWLSDLPRGSDVMVIGGGSLFEQLLPECTLAYITKVLHTAECDSYCPNLDTSPEWVKVSTGRVREYDGLRYLYATYARRRV